MFKQVKDRKGQEKEHANQEAFTFPFYYPVGNFALKTSHPTQPQHSAADMNQEGEFVERLRASQRGCPKTAMSKETL